jgi:hypothetical protein
MSHKGVSLFALLYTMFKLIQNLIMKQKKVMGYYWLIGLACKTQNDRKERKKNRIPKKRPRQQN